MYKNILLAVDFSEVTAAAAKKAFLLSEMTKAEIHTCYVLSIENIMAPSSYFSYQDFDFDTNIFLPLRKKFEEFSSDLGIKNENKHFLRGNPKEEILKLAKNIQADVIVMGGHDHSRLGMLGSVAAVLSNKAECDIVIVKK